MSFRPSDPPSEYWGVCSTTEQYSGLNPGLPAHEADALASVPWPQLLLFPFFKLFSLKKKNIPLGSSIYFLEQSLIFITRINSIKDLDWFLLGQGSTLRQLSLPCNWQSRRI